MAKKSEELIIAEMKIKAIKELAKQLKEKHKMRMDELGYSRESERIHHEHEKERQRIRSAEIRRGHERKLELAKSKGYYG